MGLDSALSANTGRVYQGKFPTHFQPIVWIPMGAFQYFRVPMRSCKCLKMLEITALQNQYSWVQLPSGAPII
jgi:hypothetical protein